MQVATAALETFLGFKHYRRMADDGERDGRMEKLAQNVKLLTDDLPSAVRLVLALVQAQLEGDSALVRLFNDSICTLIRRSPDVLTSYRATFAQRQMVSAKT